MVIQGERQQILQRTRRSRASLVLALGYVLLLLLVLLHRHPVHGFRAPAPAAATHVDHTTVRHTDGGSTVAPVEDDCLLCNLLQLPKLSFVALLVAFLLYTSIEFFTVYTPKRHTSPRLIRKQPRAPPAFS